MTMNVVSAAYIVSAVLFVLSLAGLSKHESAKEGNAFGVTGMVIALGATVWLTLSRSEHALVTLLLIALAMGIGAAIGLWRSQQRCRHWLLPCRRRPSRASSTRPSSRQATVVPGDPG